MRCNVNRPTRDAQEKPMEATLPANHPARPATAVARAVSSALGVSFTAFAWLTTQNHERYEPVRPWQDDPYEAEVSFTEFLLPTLIVPIGARALLWRPHQP
jgi:hypothetical protein